MENSKLVARYPKVGDNKSTFPIDVSGRLFKGAVMLLSTKETFTL